jgi:chemotaxis protein methyltransferase CheR
MTALPCRADVERFRKMVTSRLGFHFEQTKMDVLADVLRQRLADSGAAEIEDYLQRLSGATGDGKELRAIAEQLTVSETYFFRNRDNFRAFVELVLPDRLRARGARRHLRILSAGCASGDEAYSLAILVRDHLPDPTGWRVSIQGIDVNPVMVERATQARYSAWSLRDTANDVRVRHFQTVGKDFVLGEHIRKMASFEERNLVDEDPAFWHSDAFDVVFCRNVTMYFSLDVSRAVVHRIAHALAPGGFLFLGHAETLRGVSNEFHLCHTHETFYYQRRESSEPAGLPACKPPTLSPVNEPSVPAVPLEIDGTWVEVIQRASERIAHLSRGSRAAVPTQAQRTTDRVSSVPEGPCGGHLPATPIAR